jgi:hypothetical protein
VFITQPPILDDVSEVVLWLSHQRGTKTKKNKTKQHKTKQNKTKNPTKCPKFKWNTVSVSFSACRYSSVIVSSKREKKKSLETFL